MNAFYFFIPAKHKACMLLDLTLSPLNACLAQPLHTYSKAFCMISRCVEMCLFLRYLLQLPQTNYIFLETIDSVLSKTVHNIVVASTTGEQRSINQLCYLSELHKNGIEKGFVLKYTMEMTFRH